MIKYAYRVQETSVTQGTGTISLDGAVAGFRTFVEGVGNGAIVNYTIQEGANIESGIGTVTGGSPDTLSRDTIIFSTNSNNAINWGAGVRNVFLSVSPELQVWRDENLNDVSAVGVGGGTANAHTVTCDPVPLDYSDKMLIRWAAPAQNTDAVTVNVNSLGAKSYVNADLTAFPSGMIKAGSMQEAVYDAANNRFIRTTQAFDPANYATAAQGAKADTALQPTDVGVAVGNLVQLEDVGGNPALPAVDGSQLTHLPIVKTGYAEDASYKAIATATVFDDSAMLISEGTEIIAVNYQALKATNRLRIKVHAVLGGNAAQPVIALFKGSDNLAQMPGDIRTSLAVNGLSITHEFEVGDVLNNTYSVRAGASQNNVYVNGSNNTRLGGGKTKTTIEILEITG